MELASLYYAAPRPVIERDGALIVVDEPSRMPLRPNEAIAIRSVRFRTLGCWPVTAAMESTATDLPSIALETFSSRMSERRGRIADNDGGGSLERQKREGYL